MSVWLEQLVTWDVTIETTKDQNADEILLNVLGKPIKFGDKFPESPKLPIGSEGGGLYTLDTIGTQEIEDTVWTSYIIVFYQSLRSIVRWEDQSEYIVPFDRCELYEDWLESLLNIPSVGTDQLIGMYGTGTNRYFFQSDSENKTIKWVK